MTKFNNQFATQKLRQETSMTGTGASFTPGTGEQMATNKAFKKKVKKEEKDVEPKLAAGKAKVYMKDKWGWKDAPSVPNRPSKGGFIYKQLFEELSYVAFNHYRSTLNDAYGDLVRDNNPGAKVVGSAYDSLNIEDNPESISKLDAAKDVIVNSKLVPQQKNTYLKAIDKIKEYLTQNIKEDIYEPEEQDDDEDNYDWFTDKYEPVSDYGKYRKDSDYYEKDYQEKGTGDYFQKRSLDENYSKSEVQSRDFNVNKIWDFIESKPFNNPNYMPKFNTAEEIWNGWGPEEKEMYTNFNWEDTYGNEIHRREKAALQRRANYDALAGLNENYSKFKTETKTRGKSDQFHQAVREVRKKVQEINRLFEYVNRLKTELSEGEGGLKYKIHTEKALAKIKEMVSELNQNIKKFK